MVRQGRSFCIRCRLRRLRAARSQFSWQAHAIEGYVNYAGHAVVPDWDAYVKSAKTFSDKLKHVFAERKKTVVLDSGVYQRTIALLTFRGSLAHPRFTRHIEKRNSPPPTLFDHIEADFPASRVLEIATAFRDRFLADVGLDDLWWKQGYAEISKPTTKPRTPRRR